MEQGAGAPKRFAKAHIIQEVASTRKAGPPGSRAQFAQPKIAGRIVNRSSGVRIPRREIWSRAVPFPSWKAPCKGFVRACTVAAGVSVRTVLYPGFPGRGMMRNHHLVLNSVGGAKVRDAGGWSEEYGNLLDRIRIRPEDCNEAVLAHHLPFLSILDAVDGSSVALYLRTRAYRFLTSSFKFLGGVSPGRGPGPGPGLFLAPHASGGPALRAGDRDEGLSIPVGRPGGGAARLPAFVRVPYPFRRRDPGPSGPAGRDPGGGRPGIGGGRRESSRPGRPRSWGWSPRASPAGRSRTGSISASRR